MIINKKEIIPIYNQVPFLSKALQTKSVPGNLSLWPLGWAMLHVRLRPSVTDKWSPLCLFRLFMCYCCFNNVNEVTCIYNLTL